MGHIANPDREYRLLQQRLDRHLTGAPDSPTFTKILRLLFSPEDAKIARRIPMRPTPLDSLSRTFGIPRDVLAGIMTDMAQRGLVIDYERGGRRYVSLPPVVIGFFEFTFMRTRGDAPMAELARLFDEYMNGDDRFVRSAFGGQTQVGRTLVREEALPEGDQTEILDWERASHIIHSASAAGLSLCTCRHKASHLGKACGAPQNNCLSFNYAAEVLVRAGHARPISKGEALSVLETSKEAGLAQTGDNVRERVTYICNCCSCCCGFFQAIRRFDIRNAIVTSNWLMKPDRFACTGCGECEEACPVGAIRIVCEVEGRKKRKRATCDEDLCLGCGVCATVCRFGGATLKPRSQRTVTPETVYDRLVMMAIERRKLADLLFDDPERLSHRALGRLIGVLEKSPPVKAALAIKPLRSAFMNALVNGAKRNGRATFGGVLG